MGKKLVAYVAITLILIPYAGCGDADSPVRAAKSFVLHLLSRDMDAVASMLSRSDPEAADRIRKSLESFPLGGEETMEAEEVYADLRFKLGERSGDTAVVNVSRQYGCETLTITLVREDGAWKVDFGRSTLMTVAWGSVAEEGCQVNMGTVVSLSSVRASACGGSFPISWEDLEGYLEEKPTCPLDGSEYIVEWNASSPPRIECPNHGTP